MEISGQTPAGKPVANAPVSLAGKVQAAGTLPNAVTDGDVAHLLLDEYGRIRAVVG